MSIEPLLGLGMLAITDAQAGHPRDRLDEDQVAIEVLRRHVVAALQPAVVDIAAVRRRQVLALTRLDDVVLSRRPQQQRHRQLAVAIRHRRQAVVEERQQRGDRRAVVGDLDRLGVGDVAADARHDRGALLEEVGQHRPHLVGLRPGGRVDAHQPEHLGVLERGRQRQGAAHAEAADDDAVGAGGQALVRRLGLARPVRPSGGLHVLDRRAMAGQAGQLDVPAGTGDRLGEPAHRRRVAREAVQGEEPARRPLVGVGRGSGTRARHRRARPGARVSMPEYLPGGGPAAASGRFRPPAARSFPIVVA